MYSNYLYHEKYREYAGCDYSTAVKLKQRQN